MDSLSCHLYIKGLLPQTAATTLMTHGLSGISSKHVFILDLISVGLHPPKKLIESDNRVVLSFSRASLPYLILNLLTQIAIRLKDRNAIPHRILHYLVLEPSHLVTSPASNCPVINGLTLVRYHEILADSYNLSKAATLLTCAEGTIEAEHILIWLAECHSIRLKTVHKCLLHHL